MGPLIELNPLISQIRYYQKEMGWGEEWNNCLDVVVEIIKNQPKMGFECEFGKGEK